MGPPPALVTDIANEYVPEGCTKVCKLAFWQQFFKSSTTEIFQRVLQSIVIFKGDFIQDVQNNKPDLWYPFWIVITEAFAAFITSVIVILAGRNSGNGKGNVASIGVFVGILGGYAFVVPAIMYFICWCLDMEEMSYMVLLDLITYSFTILLPIMVIYPIFQMITTVAVMKTVAIIIYSVCAAWSFLFIVYHGLKYVKTFKGTKGQIIGVSAALIVLHAAFLVTEGCMIFVV